MRHLIVAGLAVLLHTIEVPPGQPFAIPPSYCPVTIQLFDDTGDSSADRIVATVHKKCNQAMEERQRREEDKRKGRISIKFN